MSYSYIKTVFPKFEESKVYDDKLYNLTQNLVPPKQQDKQAQQLNIQPSDNSWVSQFDVPKQKGTVIERMGNIDQKIENVPNQYYYKKPLHDITPEPSEITQFNNFFENLENTTTTATPTIATTTGVPITTTSTPASTTTSTTTSTPENHQMYIQHILNCPQCKTVLLKQLNIENDKVKYEEMLELGSYLFFGIFLLFIVDKISRK
jgi:hypothetical protein